MIVARDPTDDISWLGPEMAYVVDRLRSDGCVAYALPRGDSYLFIDSDPVCTWETMFRLLGMGIVEKVAGTNRYGLLEKWR